MQFEYHYLGRSEVQGTASRTGLSFAPDTSRAATYFDGRLTQRLPFREAISALHDVVVSDLNFKPKDRSQYLEWRAAQDELDWTEVADQRATVAEQVAALRSELDELRQHRSSRWRKFYSARQRYFNYLYEKDRDAWFVLDPVITVHPDEVSFECFSQDESSYGRLACGYEVFTQLGERACGTTNVDYSAALYDEFQKIREYKDTSLTVEPEGFDVKTTGDPAYREVKIDLPESWVRGFLQVSSAMTLPAVELSLHPMDVHNLCFALRRRRERHGPRSLRFLLRPGEPVVVIVEPWGQRIVFPRSPFEGPDRAEVRIWGRRRLHTLERLVPEARRFRVRLLGTGMPSFWLADLGDMSFTLGLSGWTSNDWSANANFDLLAPRQDVDSDTVMRVLDALGEPWRESSDSLARRLGIDRGVAEAALGLLTQAGRVVYDLGKEVYRRRELTRDPLPLSQLRFSSSREERAAQVVASGKVRSIELNARPGGRVEVYGAIDESPRPTSTSLALDADGRVVGAECTCSYYVRNKLHRGPCTHILALRIVAHRRIGGRE